ncbi:TonB-dependent receptor [Paraglaciecola sp. L3A3]|uniref:TonB-dependent receptor n=1 Tax=Paraglaciecola sp. L3A3 TaxID=2686358 RepID=UPI00131D2D2C|nr:TonB-dependent receptor [Paraglaciecola sp. L3A3]
MDSVKKRPKTKYTTLLQIASLFPLTVMSAAFAQEKAKDAQDGLEIIEVTGTYKALSDAATIKRHAAQIVDAISAGDIGKLPDTNIAEALQRVTGVTIGRDEAGDGSSFQIRGFSENSLTINGKGVVTDGFDNRENNLNAMSSSIVKSITVSKTPTADQIEGGSGGSVELTTFSPLDFEDFEARATVEANDNSLKSDPGTKFSGLISNRWELESAGTLGILFNLDKENKNAYSEGADVRYGGVDNNRNWSHDPEGIGRSIALLNGLGQAPDHAAFVPRWADINQKELEIENTSVNTAIQWAPTDNLNIEFKGAYSEYTNQKSQSRFSLCTQCLGGNRDDRGELGITLEPGATWDTLTRDVNSSEYDSSTIMGDFVLPNGDISNQYFTSGQLASGQVSRSMLTSGIWLADSENNNQGSPLNSNGFLNIEEKSSLNVGLDIDWNITDTFAMSAKFGKSESETDNTNRQMNLQVETFHPTTGRRLYPSLGYDIRGGDDLPSYEVLWREPVLAEDGVTRIGGQNIAGFNPDYTDPAQRNDLHRLQNLQKGISRTRGFIEEARLDFDWDVDFAGITRVEFGGRYDSLENWKNRSDFKTPFKPGFTDNNADGIPDDIDGDGLPDGLDRRDGNPQRTLTSLVEEPLVDGGDDGSTFSSVTYDQLDEFFQLREGMQGVSGNFPAKYWAASGSPVAWDNLINAVYGGHDVILNNLQTEKVFEDSTVFYLKFNFEYEVAGMPLTGNIGVRHGKTEGQSEAYISHCNMPWEVDQEKTAIVRAERVAYDEGPLADWEAGGKVGDQPKFEPSFWDQPLSDHQGRNQLDPNLKPKSFCGTREEPGGDQLALIFKDPFVIDANAPATGYIATGTPNEDGGSLNKDYLASRYDYNFTLPSLNLSLGIQDDMFVRFAAYKTMARPGPNDLSLDPSSWPIYSQGNPDLKPYLTESFDVSWEWYQSETDSLSVTYFTKNLIDQKTHTTDFNVALNRLVRRPINGGGGKINGWELSAVHTFDYLPEAFRGFGISANYTALDSEQETEYDEYTGSKLPVPNRSDSSYNLQFFYENHGWSARIAYNWRDMSLRSDGQNGYQDFSLGQIDENRTAFTGSNVYTNRIDVSPRSWNEEYAQIDFTLGYDFSDNLGVMFKATNIDEEVNRSYTVIPEATFNHNLAASFYRLSVNWKF